MSRKAKFSFKAQWNRFCILTHEFFERQMNNDFTKMEEFKAKLEAIDTVADRIRFLTEDAIFSTAIPQFVDSYLPKEGTQKPRDDSADYDSLSVARRFIESDYNDNNYNKQIENYTKAISTLSMDTAPNENRRELCRLLTKRAELFYILKRYDECLDDINELKKYSISNDLDFLEEMASFCEETKAKSCFRELKPKHFEVKSESKLLESGMSDMQLVYNDIKGRFIRSTKFIPRGTIIAAENPFVAWLRPNLYDSYCNYCLVKLNSRYFYCKDCFKVKYCSSECMQEALASYHSIECSMVDVLKDWAMGHMSLRMAIVAGIEEAIEMEREEKIALKEWVNKEFKNDYSCIHSLCGESCLHDAYFTASTIGALMLAILAARMNLVKENTEDFYILAALLYKHIAQVYLNTYTVYDHNLRNTGYYGVICSSEKRKKVGVSLYATSSLFSHSCDNNCYKYYSGSKIILVSLRPIAAKEEITVNYGTSLAQNTLQTRRNFLNQNFSFECRCSACEVNAECVAYALICPHCKAALVVNEDQSNYCINCNRQNVETKNLDHAMKCAKKAFECAEGFAARGQIEKARLLYKRMAHFYSIYYFSSVRLSPIYDFIAQCYAARNKFYKAYKYKVKTEAMIDESYGFESLEMVALYAECASFLEKAANLSMFRKKKWQKKANFYYEEAFKLLTQLLRADFNIIEENKVSILKQLKI
ncbi:SET and MYND domain-containing protein 4-like protein [Dinothrombium tinctorium]|uniref:Protein-lysine N-methyltransferase SMYD4 n=1 Tax=Dinothrombium tinctorium TaxID=1965070 RepID=A0A3S3PAC0_9ACAR|nr:SET and MYND domain-containing protein 4-like protein [Dinothrombium tinctorium]